MCGLAIAACDPVAVDPEPRAAEHDGATTPAAAAPRLQQAPVIGGELVVREIQWPSASEVDAELRDRLPRDALDRVDAAPLPVLIPPDPLDDIVVVTGEHWYSFRGDRDGITIVVQGSGLARVFPGMRGATGEQLVRGRPAFVSVNEGIRHAAWIEHGVAYSVEIECADQQAPQCADSAAITQLAEQLELVGGVALTEAAR
ncbi:hypothetical protein [Enhygromyxa salina]|uniref:Uncharacterized protein n=1 Tax=Enhygromyxa salina TaxID=215803 RepID=A0A2S9YS06_9BACT|nr:hypothetical protein [Enhygromyxa salina]PRQ07850.1 hypothetical protein ENSA7_24150 [Enhygromyxa salina]